MRVELAGLGDPIPTVALPDPNLDDALPPQSFVLPNGSNFVKTDYVGLGYTHYEAICIGAAGGRGGGNQFALNILAGSMTRSHGGGGGGGGLHRVVGLLSELPVICPVVVGQVGANGVDGNGHWPYNPVGSPPYPPNPSYIASQNGQDGGASTFNGDTCRASGGKGGSKTPIDMSYGSPYWEAEGMIPGGNGGEGGTGNRIIAGGGADGALSVLQFHVDPGGATVYDGANLTPAIDGIWDGIIGEGGGGGRGGMYRNHNAHAGQPPHPSQMITEDASSGGQGSFSFADTSVFGNRGNRSADPYWGKPIVPGSGGGAKEGLLKYGSYATGFSPNGLVYIRITKIE